MSPYWLGWEQGTPGWKPINRIGQPDIVKLTRKFYRRLGIGAGILLLGFIVLYFSVRTTLLQRVVDKVESRFHNQFGGHLTITDAGFSSWRSVHLQGIQITSPAEDTLFSLEDLEVKLRILPLFIGRPLPASVLLQNGGLKVVYCDSLDNNYIWLKQPTKKETTVQTESSKSSLNKQLSDLVNMAFRWLPDRIDMVNISLAVDYVGNEYALIANEVKLRDGKLKTDFRVVSPLMDQYGHLNGTVDRDDRGFDITLAGRDGQPLSLPGFYEMGGLWTELTDARLRFSELNMDGKYLSFRLFGQTDQLQVSHARLSDSLVTLPLLAMDVYWKIGARDILLDTISTFVVDRVDGHFGGSLSLGSDRQIALQVRIPEVQSTDFFSSLPAGMFRNLEGIKTEGTLAYSFDMMIQEDSLDQSVLRSALVGNNFKILEFGKTDLRKMSSSFVHQVYENDRLSTQFLVGPENPNWVPFDGVAPELRHAILTCEDPSFFHHRGFLMDAIRESMIQNLKEKRFARGGSTISMQLVKNVFLSRKKYLARKLEEILLVWLIEGQRLTPKERMFEVYLNLIEWGPGVYGVRQAADFYFAKNPADLDLSECIYLASIVPKPKKYRWYFDGLELRPQWTEFNRFIAGRMQSRGLIPAVDSISFTGQVTLRGPAALALTVPDSSMVDSTFIWLDDLMPNLRVPADSLFH